MITEIIIMAVIAFFIALALSIASRILGKEDDSAAAREILPGANCGACGFAGCDEYARAVSKNPKIIGKCIPGGKDVAEKLAELLHSKAGDTLKQVAVLKCKGGTNSSDKAVFEGIHSCESASLIGGGNKSCEYGCLGFGDCVKKCEFGAIKMGKDGYPIIDPEKCTGCGSCAQACPKGIIVLLEKKKRVVEVGCSSKDKPKKVMESCTNGCIACGLCEKNCPKGAIKVVDNVAVIDHEKCIGCGICVKNCPKKVISFVE